MDGDGVCAPAMHGGGGRALCGAEAVCLLMVFMLYEDTLGWDT